MTIQPIGATSVALYLTPADLREHGLTPGQLTQDLALELTRSAFAQAGIPVEGAMEIEAYPEMCGVLLFARFQPPKRTWFTFPDLESLLQAARALGEDAPDADLLWCDQRYWLSVPTASDQALCRLSEFADATETAPFLDARLGEHGRTLLTGGALCALLHYFPEEMI